MIEDKIEIVIPTYNRAEYLDITLNSLLNSPFKDCKITIRDNASPDNTQTICNKYSRLFTNLHIIRNKKNIGGNANILRSYEQATYPYVWVLADNDLLNFDDCDDFIEAIESEKFDLIICCSASYMYENNRNPTFDDDGIAEFIRKKRNNDEDYLINSAKDLALMIKKYYFIITTFIPSVIYKTSFIDSESLIKGYDYISLSYPHYAFSIKALNKNILTYKTEKDVVLAQANPKDSEISDLTLFYRHLESSLLIEDKEIRPFASEFVTSGSFFYNLFAFIIVAKSNGDESLKNNVFNLIGTIYKLKGWFKGFFYQLFISLCYCIPKKLCDLACEIKMK